jgi:hypothetical protein
VKHSGPISKAGAKAHSKQALKEEKKEKWEVVVEKQIL